MATIVNCFAVEGIDGFPVEIEASLITGMPCMSIIGLGDQAVQEAGDRIRAAIVASGYKIPSSKLILSLAPGDQKKTGSHYDLGMAIVLLKESKQIYAKRLPEFAIIGELSLTGNIRPSNGVLPMTIKARKCGFRNIIVPKDNVNEARLIQGMISKKNISMQELIIESVLLLNANDITVLKGIKNFLLHPCTDQLELEYKKSKSLMMIE